MPQPFSPSSAHGFARLAGPKGSFRVFYEPAVNSNNELTVGNRLRWEPGAQEVAGGRLRCYISSWMVCRARTSNSWAPLGVETLTLSPTRFPIRPRPMGDEVEIKPLLRSASSVVTNLYSTSVPRSRSYRTTLEPKATRSLGMLLILIKDRSASRFLSWASR